jgi:hypothetical protein
MRRPHPFRRVSNEEQLEIMNINQSKITHNLLGEASLPQCPRFREEAESIVAMLEKIPPFSYTSAGEFQKRIIVEYWLYYDSLETVFDRYPDIRRRVVFKDWFMKATPPENIRRACQWLVETGVIILQPFVREKALARAGDIREDFAVDSK